MRKRIAPTSTPAPLWGPCSLLLVLALCAAGTAPGAGRELAAVVPFTIDASVQERTLTGTAVAVKLEQALAGTYDLVTRSQVHKALGELKFVNSDLADPAKAQKFGKVVGARYLVSGSVVQIGRQITIAAQIFNVETGVIKQTAEVSAQNVDEFNSLLAEIAKILPMSHDDKKQYLARRGTGASAKPTSQVPRPTTSMPPRRAAKGSIFFDDFSKGFANWDTTTVRPMLHGGKLFFWGDNNCTLGLKVPVPMEDVAVEFDGYTESNGFNVLLVNGQGLFYAVSLGARLNQVSNMLIGGAANVISKPGPVFQLRKWHHYRFVRHGDRLEAYCDGRMIISCTARERLSGPATLGFSSLQSQLGIDNVRVSNPSSRYYRP